MAVRAYKITLLDFYEEFGPLPIHNVSDVRYLSRRVAMIEIERRRMAGITTVDTLTALQPYQFKFALTHSS